MARQTWRWIGGPSPDIYQRHSEVFWGGGTGAERWRDERAMELEAQAQWWITYMLQQPRHTELTLRIDEPHLLSPCLPLPLISTIPSSPSPIHRLLISPLFLSPCSLSFHFFFGSYACLSFSGPSHPASLFHLRRCLDFFLSALFLSFFFFFSSLLTTPSHSVCQPQAAEPWKCHTNKVRGSISVSQGDTFINDRSTRPCRCSITSAGARPWGAQHVRCVSQCVRARVHLCVLLPLRVLQQPGLRWS